MTHNEKRWQTVPAKKLKPTLNPAVAPVRSSGFISTVMDGLAFGSGSAIAHRAVGAVFGGIGGPPTSETAPAAAKKVSSCAPFQAEFTQCLNSNPSDAELCQGFFDTLSQCQTDARLR